MKTVVIGMSGGVDSSVAAILLKNEGYNVIGLFMRNWDSSINNDIMGNPNLNNDICPQEKDYNDAKAVCDKLNMPLHRVDFVKEYWDYVFTYFLDELKNGRTPNPDVMCNKYIKFDFFVKEAKKLGADYIATGHYAKLKDGYLYKASDENKDQSYFLAYLSKEQLQNVIFPLGDIDKTEVRKIAAKYGLITANKKDSTGICFIGERNFSKFLQNYLPAQEGNIVEIDTGKTIGRHIGLMYYTIGQRKGLNIGGNNDKLYVVGKNLQDNILYVCFGDQNKYLYSNHALLEKFNYIDDSKPENVKCKFRYRQKDIECNKINYLPNNYVEIKYVKTKSVTPGQICVIYNQNDRVVGAGIIKDVYIDDQKLWYL